MIPTLDSERLVLRGFRPRLAQRLGARREGSAEIRPYGTLDIWRHLSPDAFRAHSARLQ